MRKRDWSRLLAGLFAVTMVACQPVTEDDPIRGTAEPTLAVTPATAIAHQPTSTRLPSVAATSTSPPPPQPTPEPTISSRPTSAENWQQLGDQMTGLEITAPPQWVDFSGRIDVSVAASPLGLIVLLLADSERTGESILAGKELASGAFVAGLIANLNVSLEDSVDALKQVVDQAGSALIDVGQPSPLAISLPSSSTASPTVSDDIVGAYVDVTGDAADFFSTAGENLRSRLFLFPYQNGEGSLLGDTQVAIFLMSAPADQWENYDELFVRMIESIVIHGVGAGFSISDGAADVLGRLQTGEPVSGKLEQGVREVWAFNIDAPSYATLTLNPTDRDIDLTMAVFGPSGQTLTRVDAGYAGDAEVAVDLFLPESGLYVVEVGEFFNDSGRYNLSLVLGEEPRSSAKGEISPGEGIQRVLPDNTRHFWTFNGTAGQIVSIVLAPYNDQFDAILDLYGPDDRRLVALDEGFSGDAEVISGFELPVTGEYSILVRSFAGNGGVYTLSLDEGGEETLNYYDAGNLVDGDAKQERLRDNEAHAWFFEGRVGEVISIEVVPISENLDVDVWLLDPEIRKLAAEDNFGIGKVETIEAMLYQDGQYLVLVREFSGEPGEYEVRFNSVLANAPDDAGTLRYGETITDTLVAGQSVAWRFRGELDDLVDVKLTPLNRESDLLFILQDPASNTVLEVDAALAGATEELTGFTITVDGQWVLVIKDFFDDAAEYTLTINRRRS
jgi:hypothetical protein